MRFFKFIFFCVLGAFTYFALCHASIAPYRTSGILLGQRGTDGGPAQVRDVGAPDERQHANYAATIARGDGIPVFDPKDPNLYETYQSHQPPLYYLVVALASKVLGSPPDDASSAIPIRGINVLIGIATLIGIVKLGESVSGDKWVGLAAAAIAGLMPMFWALHGAVSNDPLLICMCTYTLLGISKGLSLGWNLSLVLWTGLAFGAALWTKTSAITLLAPLGIAAILVHSRPGNRLYAWLPICVGLILIAPWWVRNTLVLGDPLALRAFKDAFVGSAQRADLIEMVRQVRVANGLDPAGANLEYWKDWFGWWTLRSWFGAFGQMDIFLSPTAYRIGFALVAVFAGGAALEVADNGTEGRQQLRIHFVVLLSFIVAVFASFLQFNLTYFQAQGRYLYPAIAAFAVLLAIGFRRFARNLPVAVGVYLVVAVIGNSVVLTVLTEAFALRTAGNR